MIYYSKVPSKFITIRNKRAPKYRQGIHGADCEYPEYHQLRINKELKESTDKYTHDLIHPEYGRVDFKNWSQQGVKLSDHVLKNLKEGKVDHLCVWEWCPNNMYVQLKAGMEVEYKILYHISAKEALELPIIDNRMKDHSVLMRL